MSKFIINLNSINIDEIDKLNRTIKTNLIKKYTNIYKIHKNGECTKNKVIEVEYYFEYGYYMIRSYDFINKYVSDYFFKFKEIPTKDELLVYLIIARDYIDITIIQSNESSYCIECHTNDALIISKNCELHCYNCGLIYNEISAGLKESDLTTNIKSSYSERGNLLKTLKQLEGKENVDVEIINNVKTELNNRKINIDNLKIENLIIILKYLNLNKYYNQVNSIYAIITNKHIFTIDEDVRQKILNDYNEFENIYPLIKNTIRENSINMKFILYKLLIKNNVRWCSDNYRVLRTEKKLQEHENIWICVCNILNW